MRQALILLSSFWLACLAPAGFAQTGPMAPGFEILQEHQRHLAEAPLVLTPASAPDLCLDMDLADKQAKTVHLWQCAPAWNQKVWFDSLTSSGGENEVRVRIGTLACLHSDWQVGGRAALGICGDKPGFETWLMRDGRLEANGMCLAVANTSNGAQVIMEMCDPDAARQQWRLEAMRTAVDRQPPYSYDPSGFGEYHYMGFLPDVVEEFRPRFSPRTLTADERAEIKALTQPWRKLKAVDVLADYMSGQEASPMTIPWETLLRLSALGESGDKEAMRSVMEAFSLLRDTNHTTRPGGLRATGWDASYFPNADNGQFAYTVVSKLADIWAAHYWQKHGPDRLAGRAFTDCHLPRAFVCLGYKGTVTGYLEHWVWTGKGKPLPTVTDITFMPTAGTYEEREGRFLGYLDLSFQYRRNPNVYDEFFVAEQAVYADKTGRLALWDNVMMNRAYQYPMFTSEQELYMRQTLAAREDAAQWAARFEAFMANPSPTPYERGLMQQELISRSDADLFRYAEKHEVWFSELEPRLCATGRETSGPCQALRARIIDNRERYAAEIAQARVQLEAVRRAQAAAQAERDEAYRKQLAEKAASKKPDFWDQLAGLAEGFAAAAEAGNQQVVVRNYDSAGNYIGSETMTRARAGGLGAQPTD
ncbi:MAG: ricin-type beta-trefoil lectin domain protein [Pannonibacter sp.]